MKKQIAAIVLHYNGFQDTFECIESFKKNENVEIYIIDNASTDGSGLKIKDAFPEIKYFLQKKNLGYAAGNNFGLKKAIEDGFEYLLIVNNDVVVDESFLQPMLNEFESDYNVGVVTCKVLYKDNPTIINAAGGKFSKLLCTGVNLRIGTTDKNEVEVNDIDFIPGMIMLLKKNVIEKVGYMKEYFFLYFEDVEYSLRIKKYFKMRYTSKGKVFHSSKSGVRGKSYSSTYLFYHTRNRLWMFKGTSILYFIYTIVFTFINSFVKSIIVLLNRGNAGDSKASKITQLWKGYFHGIFLSPDFQ